MKKIKSSFLRVFIQLIYVFVFSSTHAQISLPSMISDNMLLQQNIEAPIWGWAKPGDEITIITSWDNIDHQIITDEEGKWFTKIQTPSAGGPYSITINDSTIKNVMIGEVWICSGQSNMQWALSQSDNSEEEISKANFPNIRLFYVARDNSSSPNEDVYGMWEECSPEVASSFSAVAYYFGKALYNELKIPIGLIHTSWGGSSAQAWINHDVLASTEIGKFYIRRFDEKIKNTDPGINPRNHQSPSSLYNGMLNPIIPFGIKGAIWYQGESNTNEHYMYTDLMEILINNWRNEWDQGTFPFYYVQLAPFTYNKKIIGAALRDAQREALNISNTGMAVTMDIGDPDDIHPLNKKDVGQRLSLYALAKTYGKEGITYSGPLYKTKEIEKDKIRIYFDHIGSGLTSVGDTLSCFTIAGMDKVFYPADALIENNTILVSSSNVEDPVAVRFAFNNGDEPNLFNKEGLPASTFRTDDWDIITETAKITSDFDPMRRDIIVKMANDTKNEIRYTLNGMEPTLNSNKYVGPIIIKETSFIKSRVFIDGSPSLITSEAIIDIHSAIGKKVIYKDKYDNKFPGGGKFGLVNSLIGTKDYYDGKWQGFHGKNFDITIDLEEKIELSEIKLNFLQKTNSWIVLPKKVKVFFSDDGKNFREISTKKNDIPPSDMGVIIEEFKFEFNDKASRYIKIVATNFGPMPHWHAGAGDNSWLFVDEVIIK